MEVDDGFTMKSQHGFFWFQLICPLSLAFILIDARANVDTRFPIAFNLPDAASKQYGSETYFGAAIDWKKSGAEIRYAFPSSKSRKGVCECDSNSKIN